MENNLNRIIRKDYKDDIRLQDNKRDYKNGITMELLQMDYYIFLGIITIITTSSNNKISLKALHIKFWKLCLVSI